MKSRLQAPVSLMFALCIVVMAASCRPQTVVEEERPHTSEPAGRPEPAQDEGDSPAADGTLTLTLLSQRAITEHSPIGERITEPPPKIEPPPEDSWRILRPHESAEFHSYDGVRVSEEGEAWLDLGDLMHLILKRDSVAQFVPGEDERGRLADLAVLIPDGTPLLQRLVLGIHLSRGGLVGDKLARSDTIALTTPNAVIIVSGTQFFVVYDQERDMTIAGNFDGTVDVVDVAAQEAEPLRSRQMISIPPVNGQRFWPMNDEMNFGEFQRLIDILASPMDAARMLSGPYLIIARGPSAEVYAGPDESFEIVGRLDEGFYARILAESDRWWELECPAHLGSRGSDCWVSKDDARAYNADVPRVPPTKTPTPRPEPDKPTPKPAPDKPTPRPLAEAMCEVTASSIGLWEGPGGQRGDGGLIYNRVGYLEQGAVVKILGTAYSNQWYLVEAPGGGAEGWVYAENCARVNDAPLSAVSGWPPTVTFTPSPTPTPTPTFTPTPTRTPTPTITPFPTVVTTEPVYADFYFYEDGLTVTFVNYSSGADSYYWDFGDGSSSTAESPTHTYVVTSEGYYSFDVTLFAYGPGGSDSRTIEGAVSGNIID